MDQATLRLAQESLSEEELTAWRNDPITRKILARMDLTVEHIKHQWYEGKFRETSGGEESRRNEDAYWQGFANGIHEFIRVEPTKKQEVPTGLKGDR